MTEKLKFRAEGGVSEKVAAVLGVKPRPQAPLVDKVRKVEILNLLNVTRMIENNNYRNICGALAELKKGGTRGLEFVAENTSSIDVCMAIVNGDFPGHVRMTAEKRLANLGLEFNAISKIRAKIERLEHEMKNGYLDINETTELLQANRDLTTEIKKLCVGDLYRLAAGSRSVHVCQAIISGEYQDDVKAIAESRLEQLRG